MSHRPVLAALTGLALLVPLAVTTAQAAPQDPPPDDLSVVTTDLLDRAGPPAGREGVTRAMAEATGQVTAFVELDAPSGLDTAEAGGDTDDVIAAAAEVEQLAADVVPSTRARRADAPRTISVTTAVVAGALVTGDAEQLRALADDPAVTAVHLVRPRTLTVKGSDVFTRALEAWVATGATGEGVTVGVIDTGVDYTHATFGGPGTTEAYGLAYGEDGTGPVPDGMFDPDKFLGGYDFAGPTYDASGSVPGTSPVPVPDENPIDAPHDAGGGHGTHVAATAVGYGVTADGATFTGDHTELDDISDWRVGPGTAPLAGVYALKVFGDLGGSTALSIQALEWAADPNGDHDYSDRLDIVNMSLGSDFAATDDPENLFVDRLSEIGVLTVTSAGNGGDVTDVSGSPSNARTALTVANSVGDTATYDAVDIIDADDEALVGRYPAQTSIYYTGTEDVVAPVAFLGEDVTGCSSLTEYADELDGSIAWLFWDDDDATRECGSYARWQNAQDAGAVGVLIGSQLEVFEAGIAGNEGIPGAQLTASATEELLPAIRDGGVVVQVGPSLVNAAFTSIEPFADTLNSGSSRGVHGSLGVIKPDVAAPGTLISAAASGTGDDRVTYSGTSMSSPHAAGIAALVAQTHPDWDPLQVKAVVMNTATHDVFSGAGRTGPVYGPERVGSGRVDALAATTTDVIAYATEAPDLVSVTFGLVPVGAETVVESRTVTVDNFGDAPVTYATSFAQATAAGEASITVSPAEVTVPAGGSAEVTVTLTVDPSTLAREIDPTMTTTYLGGAVPREFVTSVSGRLVLTPGTGSALRVPVQAVPRPVSDLTVAPVTIAEGETSAAMEVAGRGVSDGGWFSLMAPFALLATSDEVEVDPETTSATAVRSGDVRHVGFASTAPQLAAAGQDPSDGTLGLALSMHGEWATLGTTMVPIVNTDVDGDGIWDFETYVWKYSDDMDLTVAETYALDYVPGTGYLYGDLVAVRPVNGLWATVDTTVFDSDVLVVPLGLDELGAEPGDTPTFLVATYSEYATDGFVDVVGPFTVDPYDPPLWFDGGPGAEDSLWFYGQPGEDVTVHAGPGAVSTDMLVLHTHNTTGERAEVVEVDAPEVRDASTVRAVGPTRVVGSRPVPIVVAVTSEGAPPAGFVQVRLGETLLGQGAITAHGRFGVGLVQISGLAPGQHEITLTYLGNTSVAPSSTTHQVTVSSLTVRCIGAAC